MLKMKATVVSQFAQIEKGDTVEGGVSKVFLKTVKTFVEDSLGVKRVLRTPVMTGNGIRGMLRREMTAMIIESLVQKGLKCGTKSIIDSMDFNLMNAGGGNDFQAQSLLVENQVRELNPLISIFGTSLAISGKLSTPNAQPFFFTEDGEAYIPFVEAKNNKNIPYVYSPLIADETFVKKDDILQGGENTKFLTTEQIIEWRENVNANQKARNMQRDTGDGSKVKVKKTSIQSLLSREYIISGSEFYTYFEDIQENMTTIEKGLFVLALERFISKKLGSTKSRGYGAFEYEIDFDDGSKLATKVDITTSKVLEIYKEYTLEMEENIKTAMAWLEHIDCDNIAISKVLK